MSLARSVLALLCVYPGQLTASDIAAHLFPPPKLDHQLPTAAAWREWGAAKEAHIRATSRRVSRALGKLQEQGLVAPCRPPHLAAWFLDDAAKRGLALALHRAHPAWPGKVPALGRHFILVGRLGDEGPMIVHDLLGATPDGATKRAYRELVEWGIVVAPSLRWATAAGVALVEVAA